MKYFLIQIHSMYLTRDKDKDAVIQDEFGSIVNVVWVQGIVTRTSFLNSFAQRQQSGYIGDCTGPHFYLDDGTATVMVKVDKESSFESITVGTYLLLRAAVCIMDVGNPVLIARIMELISEPNMETLWPLEIIQCQKRLKFLSSC